MPSEPASPPLSNTPDTNPLCPLPIEPLPPDDPMLTEIDPTPAGAYRLDIGSKPIRIREELRALISGLATIQRHLKTLQLPNVRIVPTAIVNISDRISLDMIDDEFFTLLFTDENIRFNTISNDNLQIIYAAKAQ